MERFSSYALKDKRRLFLFLGVIMVISIFFVAVSVKAQVNQQGVSVTQLYQNARGSVVVINCLQPQTSNSRVTYSGVQGSGFVYSFNGRMVIVTNNHVVYQAVNISVTFSDGNAYSASILGSDPYSDLAVLQANAPSGEYQSLQLTSSSSLTVGGFVAAIGTPFGLAGSITTGIVSALGRTITESTVGNYPISNVIQTDVAINPGNSGGPLLNANGQVVGITTAIVSGSTGLAFAVPSDTISREISSLVTTGSYTQHPYLGISSIDMSYDIASQTGVPVTYGVLVEQVISGGPAANAGIKGGTTQRVIDGTQTIVGGDDIIALNGTRIINDDALASYLDQNTLPGQVLDVTVVRSGSNLTIPVVLSARPTSSGSGSTPLPMPELPNLPTIGVIAIFSVATFTILLLVKKGATTNDHKVITTQ